jgi:hypothetical protein
MISIKRMKNSTKERLIGLIDKNEVFAVERSVFEPSWKVAHYSKLPNDIAKLKEYAKCMNDIIFATEYSR